MARGDGVQDTLFPFAMGLFRWDLVGDSDIFDGEMIEQVDSFDAAISLPRRYSGAPNVHLNIRDALLILSCLFPVTWLQAHGVEALKTGGKY